MVKVEVISDKPNKRILRCSEGNRGLVLVMD